MAEITMLPVERLFPHPDNPRKDLGDVTELAESIRANGILQNLTVVPIELSEDELECGALDFLDYHYHVLIGHRRLAAAKLAGLTHVPCAIVEMSMRDQVSTMLTENMQRVDLTVYEQAQGFQMMLDLGCTVDEVADRSGFTKATVKRRLKMMELDQDILKKVSEERQLSLSDFDTLAQIEDIEKRNEALESIGTRDFTQKVTSALRQQKQKKNLPLVKAWLKEVGAKKLKNSEQYSGKYDSYGKIHYIYVAEWGEGDNKPPKIVEPVFYILDDSWGRLFLYKEAPKKQAVKKSPEEIAIRKAIAEAWNSLDAAAEIAYTLRKRFAEQITVTRGNRETVLYGALMGHMVEAVSFNSPDRSAIKALFGISDGYDEKTDDKLTEGLRGFGDKDLAKLVYAGFGDSASRICTGSTYRSSFPEYRKNVVLELLYDWLISLGYTMSSCELELLSGELEGYHAKTAYEASKRKEEKT